MPEPFGVASAAFGVGSEVGRLRKVMVHRPELSLQRLTPTTHDDLLFDDVLWVERAQYEHDQFVAKMRDRGVDVVVGLLLAVGIDVHVDVRSEREGGAPIADGQIRIELCSSLKRGDGSFVIEAVMQKQTPPGFPLKYAPPYKFLPERLFLADSELWKLRGDSNK